MYFNLILNESETWDFFKLEELKEVLNDPNINWHNFKEGDKFYASSCTEFIFSNFLVVKKYGNEITLLQIKES